MYFDKKTYDSVAKMEGHVSRLGRVDEDVKKHPESHLNWIYDDVMTDSIMRMAMSYPDKVLHGDSINSDGQRRVFRYGKIGDASSIEYGIDTTVMNGTIKFMHITPNSVVYVTSNGQGAGPGEEGEKTWIYKAEDIFSAPTLILENTTGTALQMSCHSYYDGFTDIVLVGIYGHTNGVIKDLLMSTDGGDTFSLIKRTTVTSSTPNSHWHAVWYDHYQGRIWAAEGDDVNRNLWFTDDYGENWQALDEGKDKDLRHQPTLIFGWGNRVVFGRDASYKNPGLDSYERAYTTDERNGNQTVIDNYTLRIDESASINYPRRGIGYTFDGEAYILFRSSKDATQLIATGDYGASWHGVHASRSSDTNLRHELEGITHDGYLLGVVSAHKDFSASRLVYAKKLNWI